MHGNQNRIRGDFHSHHVRAEPGGLAAGGDLYAVDNSLTVNADDNPWDEVFDGRGPGRVVMAVGGILSITGFVLFGWVIFSSASAFDPGPLPNMENGPDFGFISRMWNRVSPFERAILGVPALPIGFFTFLGGLILAAVGNGMSRATRRRDERRHPPTQWR